MLAQFGVDLGDPVGRGGALDLVAVGELRAQRRLRDQNPGGNPFLHRGPQTLMTSLTQRSSTPRSWRSPRMPTTHTVNTSPTSAAHHQTCDGHPGSEPGEHPGHHERHAEPEAGAEDHHQLRFLPT